MVERLKKEHFDSCCLGQSFTNSGFSREKGKFLKRKLDFGGEHKGEKQNAEGGLLAGELRLCLVRKGGKVRLRHCLWHIYPHDSYLEMIWLQADSLEHHLLCRFMIFEFPHLLAQLDH